ncbi:hypothetical protein ACWDBW_29975 [Streptomyces sp. NPDC001107]
MDHTVGTEIEATAQWLEEHAAPGAATVLRRVARQRDQARTVLAAARARGARQALAWRSARQRVREAKADTAELTRQLCDRAGQQHGSARPSDSREQDVVHENALMRVDLARFQNLVERAGWLPDSDPRRLWRWRDGWWELAHRKRNPKDGYPDTGWYLWGPAESHFGKWTASTKADAAREADRLITQHLAAAAELPR